MGEGAALFVVKRLADAEHDGDRIYAVVRGIGSASDGKGKGITAPNPVGQRLAVERAWENAGLDPADCSLIEGHGTSTRVGDVVEVTALGEAFSGAGLAPGSVALGSVKSNIGHLKAAAGAAGMLKATLALHHKLLPPSLGFAHPNPNIDWTLTPFKVNTELREWDVPPTAIPAWRASSAFGFGGTNFHVVLEEHEPGRLTHDGRSSVAFPRATEPTPEPGTKAPLRGALVVGAADPAGLSARLRAVADAASRDEEFPLRAPDEADLRAAERIAIDYGDVGELAQKAGLALRALDADVPAGWSALVGRGIFRGSGAPGKVAFMYTGQGSQYANMLGDLRSREPVVAEAFDDRRPGHGAAARGAPALGSDLHRHRRRRRDGARRRRSCAAPRSPSRRSSPPTWRSRACSASTGSRPTSSWATASASTERSSPPACSRSTPRWRRSARGAARWPACRSVTPA